MSKDRGDIYAEPREGWHHDNKALAVGEGLFYSVPVTFVGHVVLKESLTKLSDDERTLAIRVMMRRLLREGGILKKPETKSNPKIDKFTSGTSLLAMLPVNLCISAEKLLVTPNIGPDLMKEIGMQANTVLLDHKMIRVSMAAGGAGSTYDLVAYVAKDRKCRACYVFDCGKITDEVFATLGQAFIVAQDLSLKKMQKPDFDDIEVKGYLDVSADDFLDAEVNEMEEKMEAVAVSEPPEVESAYGNIVHSSMLTEVVEMESVYETMEETPVPVIEDTFSYMPMELQKGEEDAYDVSIPQPQKELVTALNKRDSIRRAKLNVSTAPKLHPIEETDKVESVSLERADTKYQDRPTWVCISETAVTKDPGAMNTLLKNFKLRAAIDEIISSEDEDE
eukprot:m.110155 g.110155  ORF g.110155 m.110155 type:complete len:393 (-) comp9218_c0_seq1:995-2173(-)